MVRIEEITVDWTDELVADVNAFENSWRMAADPEIPPMPVSVTRTHLEKRGYPVRLFAARGQTGSVIGTAWVELSDNYPVGAVLLAVAPSKRRQGVATALLAAIVDVVAAKSDSFVLISDDTTEACEAFAASLGATVAQRAHTNRLVIADVDRDEMARWRDATHPDYALEWVTPDGPYPDSALDDMSHLRGVLLNDAPMDDVPVKHRTISHDELRADEQRQVGYGRLRWTLLARHTPSGVPAGYTEVFIDTNDARTVYQGATAVDAAHRGHALGRQLKAVMLDRVVAERPDAECIRTYNADSNGPMLAVNHAMGFKPLFAATRWMIDTKDVREWLDKRK